MLAEQFLWVHSELKMRPLAEKQSRRNVEMWLSNNPNTIVDIETRFIYANDLINIVSKRKSPLRKLVERIEGFHTLSLFGATVRLRVFFTVLY